MVDDDIKKPPTSMQEATERIVEHKAALDFVKHQVAAWNRHKTLTARYAVAVEAVHSAWELQLKHSLEDLKIEVDLYNAYVQFNFDDYKDNPGKFSKFSQEASETYQRAQQHFEHITAKRRKLSIPHEDRDVLNSEDEEEDEMNLSSSSGKRNEGPEDMQDSVPGHPVPAEPASATTESTAEAWIGATPSSNSNGIGVKTENKE